ncbi:MAG TPA: PAS domain-containing protein, partial [Noviherbaspirillum sp.]|nr:PAS domain-containing protein [Noviherbaspirillum sp.]
MFLDHTVGDIQTRYRELADILDQMPVGILIAEAASGRPLFLNATVVGLLGNPVSVGASNDVGTRYNALHEDGTPYAPGEYPLARAVRGETVGPEEIPYVRSDGSRGCLRVAAAPVKDARGRTIKVIETVSDVSREWQARQARQQQLQAQLADAATKLRLAGDIAGLGFWEWDIRSNDVYFSPQWKRHLGYRDEELPNRYEEWESRVHPA